MSEENKVIARRHFEDVWNKGNLDVFDETVATDYVHLDPALTDVRNFEDYKQYISAARIPHTGTRIPALGDSVIETKESSHGLPQSEPTYLAIQRKAISCCDR